MSLVVLLPTLVILLAAIVGLTVLLVRTGRQRYAAEAMAEELARQNTELLDGVKDAVEQPVAASSAEAERWKKKFWSLHKVIESTIRQRDEWKAMYHESVAEHLEGQAMLEQEIIKLRSQLGQVVAGWNKDRKERDLKPVTAAIELHGAPLGQVQAYLEKIKTWSQRSRDLVAETERELAGDAEPIRVAVKALTGDDEPKQLPAAS